MLIPKDISFFPYNDLRAIWYWNNILKIQLHLLFSVVPCCDRKDRQWTVLGFSFVFFLNTEVVKSFEWLPDEDYLSDLYEQFEKIMHLFPSEYFIDREKGKWVNKMFVEGYHLVLLMDVIKMEGGMSYKKTVLWKRSFKINRSQCDEYYEHMI